MSRALAVLVALVASAGASAQPVVAELEAARPAGWAAPDRWAARAEAGGAARDTADAPPEAWLARDKALHAGGSFLLTLAGQYVLTDKSRLSNAEALPVAAGAALALGLLKEVADGRRPRYPHFCWRDLAADAAGVALAATVVAL